MDSPAERGRRRKRRRRRRRRRRSAYPSQRSYVGGI
jgi:hypothetical protein